MKEEKRRYSLWKWEEKYVILIFSLFSPIPVHKCSPRLTKFTGFNVFASILWTTVYTFKVLCSWFSTSCPLVSGEHPTGEASEGTERLMRRPSPWDAGKALSPTTTCGWKAGMGETHSTRFRDQGSHSVLAPLWALLGWGLGCLQGSLTPTYWLKLAVKSISRACTFSAHVLSL